MPENEKETDNLSVEFRPVVIDKSVYDSLLQGENPADAIALYNFYYYTAVWQKTNQPRATKSYVLKALKFGETRFTKAYRSLEKYNLVKRLQGRRGGNDFAESYIQLNYYAKVTTVAEVCGSVILGGSQKKDTNAYSNNNINAYSSNINNISKDILATPIVPLDEIKVEKQTYGNPDINQFLLSLREITGIELDGSVKDNRYYASNILRKYKQDAWSLLDSLKVLKENEPNNRYLSMCSPKSLFYKVSEINKYASRYSLTSEYASEIEEIKSLYVKLFSKSADSGWYLNYDLARKKYSFIQIQNCIRKAKEDKFWSKSLSLSVLFSPIDSKGNLVDRIAQIGVSQGKVNASEMDILRAEQDARNRGLI